MSAALVVLPVVLPEVWAFAEVVSARSEGSPVSGRKGPQSLRLVRASAEFEPDAVVEEPPPRAVAPEMAFYRKYTEAMLRRCLTLSMEGGRVSSVIGRELFRGNVSNTTVHSFDDVVMADLNVLKSQMEQVMGIGQPGRLHHIEERVARNEQGVQRIKGVVGAFGTGLTMVHLAISYFMGRHG